MPTTPAQPYDPRHPLAEEEAQLPSIKLGEEHTKNTNESFTKHLASELRKTHSDIPQDATDEEIFTAVHSVEVPDATPEEFWEALKTTYGYTWKPPAGPNILQQGGALVGDIATSLIQDVVAIPKGVVELGQGMGKIAAGEMQGMKTAAFTGASQGPSSEMQEGLELVDKAKAHFARGGAFAAGSLAAMATGGIVSPLTAKLGLAGGPILKRLAGNALVGAADAGAFMGVYGGIREGAETGASPGEAWSAFVEGTKSGAVLGAGIGVGGTLVAPAVKKAWEAGAAAVKANTLTKAKGASVKFSETFMPEWVPPEMAGMNPDEFAVKLITELHGKDVADSKVGARAATVIAEKIRSYRKFTDPPAQPSGPSQAKATGENLVWTVGIEEAKGVTGIYNVTAPTEAAAREAAGELATKIGGKVSTELTPELEKRGTDRRSRFAGPPEGSPERRTAERRGAEPVPNSRIVELQKEAEVDLAAIDKMSNVELVKYYRKQYPSVKKFPYKNAEGLREFLKGELEARIKGSKQAIEHEAISETKIAPTEELVKSVKTAPPERKAVVADELRARKLEAVEIVEEVPAAPKEVKGKGGGKTVKASPGRTFLIGRGQNGQVRVAFPTQDLADLYALLGRIRGNFKTGKAAKYSATTAAREADRLGKSFGMSRKQLFDLATLYRKQINEFVKEHKTYEETGEILSAPELKTLHETTDPELIRRMAKAKQEGSPIRKTDLTALGKGVSSEIKKISKEKLHKTYRDGVEQGRKIKDWKIVDLMDEFSPELLDDIASTTEYEPLLKTLQTNFNLLQGSLSKLNKEYAAAEFTGFSAHDHFGANLERVVTGSKSNHILVNPWSTLDEVMIRVKQELTENTPEAIADDMAGQLASTLLHELSHQEAKSEAAVAGVYTRNVGHFIDILPGIKAAIAKQIEKGKLLHHLRRHRDELFLDSVVKKHKETIPGEITAKEAEVNIHDYLPVQELGLEEINID